MFDRRDDARDREGSVTKARVQAVAAFGFTERQCRFLVTVMVHAGCFLERQYCTFTGTVRGHNSREFIGRLVARGFVRVIEPGPVRRGRLYHVHHKPLYEAIGQANNRNRLHKIDAQQEIDLYFLCPPGAAMSNTEMVSTTNGLKSIDVQVTQKDAKRLKGRLRGGVGNCPASNGTSAYCEETSDYTFDAPMLR